MIYYVYQQRLGEDAECVAIFNLEAAAKDYAAEYVEGDHTAAIVVEASSLDEGWPGPLR
jgi:hypothetical protein